MDFVKEAWYWQLPDGRVWSTAASSFVDAAVAQAWAKATGLSQIPPSPVDAEGQRTLHGLQDALVFYGLPLGELTPSQTLAEQLAQIDAETSTAILAGFPYDINGKTLHFSYKLEDQQNFADTANAATLATMGVPGVPQSVTWNGWEHAKDAEDNTTRQLVRLTLTPQEFLALYLQGALAHKATCMELGGQRKAALEAESETVA
ncbi:DUF4376 domain-containing protein [Desulfovibrio cuneatus]|uniref:DUF4376 domain-containing protein n=1 Tax=Desulfovibrio cuneatus TaxID=159728 RepID=UPI000425A07E|nr:hypothetical protein [Desulfovibrio cuneatus]